MTPRLFRFRYCFVSLFCCVGLVTASAFGLSATEPAPREDDWWQERHETVNARVREANVDLLMIGDSITHGWDNAGQAMWEEHYAHRNAVNMGFSGDRTPHVLWRLANGHLEGIRPKLAVLMIGTNNYKVNTAEEIADGVRAIVAQLRDTLPEMNILLLAIFPRADVDEQYQERLQEATALFAQTASDPMVTFLDINSVFLDSDGALSKEVMPDLLHPKALGYARWAHAVEPTIARLMGETDWANLFNERDLTGWQQVGGDGATWGAEDGLLYTDGDGGGWLATTRTFADFELALEFKTPPGGNSGVFLRAPLEGSPAFAGLEIQILDDYAPEYAELKPWQYCGSVYALIAPSEGVTKPAGEWQHMYIRYEGREIEVKLNGATIIDDTLDNYQDQVTDHPGVARDTGHIGLQNHGSRLDFRNVHIRELP